MALGDLDTTDSRPSESSPAWDVRHPRVAHLRIVNGDETPTRSSLPERFPPGSTRPEGPDFDEVYSSYFGDARRSLALLGVPSAHLDDAAQDVFVVVHRRLEDFEGRSSIRTWVLGIARRVASQYRRRGFREWRRRDAWAREVEESTSYLDGAIANQEAAEVLEAFLDTLSEPQREAFVLGAVQGLTRKQMAEALGISPNTAASRLRLARLRFKERVLDPEAQELLLLDWRARKSPTRLVTRARALLPVFFGGERGAGLLAKLSLFGKAAVVSGAVAGSVLAADSLDFDFDIAPPAISGEGLENSSLETARPASKRRAASTANRVQIEPVHVQEEGVAAVAADAMQANKAALGPSRSPATAGSEEDLTVLAAELEILRQAQDAYKGGQLHAARAALKQHQRDFPTGRLAIDRDFLEGVLSCEGADPAHAREVVMGFTKQYPGTAQAIRLAGRCSPAPRLQRPGSTP